MHSLRVASVLSVLFLLPGCAAAKSLSNPFVAVPAVVLGSLAVEAAQVAPEAFVLDPVAAAEANAKWERAPRAAELRAPAYPPP
jgi:hypothetical protein